LLRERGIGSRKRENAKEWRETVDIATQALDALDKPQADIGQGVGGHRRHDLAHRREILGPGACDCVRDPVSE